VRNVKLGLRVPPLKAELGERSPPGKEKGKAKQKEKGRWNWKRRTFWLRLVGYEPGAAEEAVEQGLALGLATPTQRRRWNQGVEEEEEQTIEMNSANRGLFSSGSDYDSSSCPCLGSILLWFVSLIGVSGFRK